MYLSKPEASNAKLWKLQISLEFSLELSTGDFAIMEQSCEAMKQTSESLKKFSF